MRRRTAQALVAGLLALLAFGALAGVASAGEEQYPPVVTTGPLTVTDPGNGTIQFSGRSCGANMTVTITFNGVQVATATTDAQGNFSGSFTIPANTAPGTYSVVASNNICVLSNTVTVPVKAQALALTGRSSTIPMAWVGVGVIALGAALLFIARRRVPASSRS